MLRTNFGWLAVTAVLIASPAVADVTVDYTIDAGGDNPNGPSGLSASAVFSVSGDQLSVLLINTSTGAPLGAEVSDSLLVSLGLNLLDGITILSGDSALIGSGSIGLGQWSGLAENDSVAEEWLWSNGGGGDLLGPFAQIISTSSGLPGSGHLDFDGNRASVSGPFGGIAASPPILAVPDAQRAVSDSILFSLTLSGTLSEAQLSSIAMASMVEFGSDFQYMTTPAPGALALFGLALVAPRRRRG